MSEGPNSRVPEACIVHLTTENKGRWHRVMAAAVLATGDRLYAFFDGLQPCYIHLPWL